MCAGHSAQRVLQQAESAGCLNCSSNVIDSVAGEIISPEEAVPEEMAPDQEPPAIVTPARPAVVHEQVDVKGGASKTAAASITPVSVIKPADKISPPVATSPPKPFNSKAKGE